MTSSSKAEWYLVHCQTHKEFFAASMLEGQPEIEVYIPRCQIRSQGKIRNAAFFPGYLFIHTDLQKGTLSKINATPGVIKLVEFGDEPCAIPADVISGLQRRLEEYNQQGVSAFKHGDHVRVNYKGPLQDLDLIFVGPVPSSQRAYVLLNFLGRIKKIQIDEKMLERSERVRSERFTRGKGRKINRSAGMLETH